MKYTISIAETLYCVITFFIPIVSIKHSTTCINPASSRIDVSLIIAMRLRTQKSSDPANLIRIAAVCVMCALWFAWIFPNELDIAERTNRGDQLRVVTRAFRRAAFIDRSSLLTG